MKQRCSCRYPCVLLLALMFGPSSAIAQTATYHLHKETSKTGSGVLQLKSAAPDTGAATFNVDLKNRPIGEYPIKAFDTASGTPNWSGVIASGSTVSFALWMRKTSATGAMYARARLHLNSASGATLCEATSATPLTTTLEVAALSCRTAADLAVSSTDRLYLWTGAVVSTASGNVAVKAELRIEGTLNGNYDSQVVVPIPAQRPTITNISPVSGAVGSSVVIAGANFGGAQGTSNVTFNGVVAAPIAWTDTAITTPVPTGAASGPVVVTVASLASNGVSFTVTESEVSGPISYAYDAVGRLIQMTSASGPTAVYRYDAVGNILAIERFGNSGGGGGGGGNAVGISGFAPSQGVVGTNVTISGAGFSSTLADNVVEFNGTAASVVSATPTALVADVPAGATTGPIRVTTPAGAATSASAFTVLPTNGAPTITGFSPTIGATGAVFTITGTNFETTPANDRLTLNIRTADASAATVSTITTSVPLASMGGRIAVVTPGGTAVSAPDFFVVPSPYGAGDVEFAQRVTPGQSQNVAINTAGRIALLLFDGTAGQKTSVLSISNIWTSCFGNYVITLYAPDASVVKSVGNGCGSTLMIDQTTLPQTGTYTLMLDPNGANTGSASVTVYTFADVTGPIAADGTSVAVSITAPGQNARFTFTAAAGQVVTGLVTNATIPGYCGGPFAFYLTLLRPDGSTQGSIPSCGGWIFLDRQALPVTGTYTLMLDPVNASIGDATINLYTVVDVVVPAASGNAVTVSLTTPGQNARLTFNGTPGQVVSGLVTNATIPGYCGGPFAFYLTLLRPDGSAQASIPSCGGWIFLDRQTLSMTGTYTLQLDPVGASIGNATVTFYDVVDVVQPIADATTVPVTITTPGQNARFTFTGYAGQIVTGRVTDATIPGYCGGAFAFALTLLNPDGSTHGSIPSCGGGIFLDRQTLSVTGTYTLKLDPVNDSTGFANVTLYTVVDVTGSIQLNGPGVPVTLTTPGQYALLTFSGTAGQVVTASLRNSTIFGDCWSYAYYLSILKPDGSYLVTQPSCGADLTLVPRTLPVTGIYTIRLDPTEWRTGSGTIVVTSQ